MRTNKPTWWTFIRTWLTILAIMALIMALGEGMADAQPDVCPEAGKVEVQGPASITVTAPEGQLITGYCVKAGPTTEYVSFDPPLSTVTIAHTSGKDISHYTLEYTWESPEPTPEPEPTSEPTPTVSSTPTPTTEPSPSPRSTPSATPKATPPPSNETPPASPTSRPEPTPPTTEATPKDSVTPGETFGSTSKSERKVLAYTGDWTSWLVTVALLFISTGLYAMLWQARAEAAEARRDLEEYKEAVVKYVKAGMK